ncbi:MAG: hypothetical protein KC996_09355 [Phycisphaerales bacterium]|nr:hypothetical protein [Phycisphaerales bacterium]
MLQTVVLLHSTPDGGHHFDWMVEQPTPGIEHRLMTWRCGQSPAEWGWDGRCERIEMHREAYLHYEGAISGGRGSVRRIARGEVLEQRLTAEDVDLSIRWGERTIRYRGWKESGKSRWIFCLE